MLFTQQVFIFCFWPFFFSTLVQKMKLEQTFLEINLIGAAGKMWFSYNEQWILSHFFSVQDLNYVFSDF